MFVDPTDLARHAVCLGMTGSGKTGLCVGLLEDVAATGVPVLALDPKGDLANMALVFPELVPDAFRPWTPDPEGAARTWKAATPPGATAAWARRVEVRVLTPGSESGIPVDVLTTLTRAPRHLLGDPEGLRELVTGAVSALLGLIGRAADPLTDPSAILLSRLLGDAFARGEDLPLDTLIPQVVDPPFSELGYFAVETFLPRPERLALAKALNTVVASPAFAPWRQGAPLDVGAWLTPAPRTPVTVLYLAHLDEAQRMFFVTLLMHQVVAWSRRQPGSSALRALVYFDEVMGYLPPHPRNPTSKWPVLALMKQARAVGVGVMLCTQNPVDLDYKAMSNAATWLVGRLQTRQDRARVLDGLATAGVDTAALEDALAALEPRSFVVRGAGPPRTVRSRHTLAFLRGPLTRGEVARLSGGTAAAAGLLGAPPPPPDDLPARWLSPAGSAALGLPAGARVWRPALVARWAVRFRHGGWVQDETVHQLLYPLVEDAAPRAVVVDDAQVARKPAAGRYAPIPAWLFRRNAVRQVKEAWRDRIRAGGGAGGAGWGGGGGREGCAVGGLGVVVGGDGG
jgi:hypothetical protein